MFLGSWRGKVARSTLARRMRTFPELVEQLQERYGATTQRDLARALGYPEGDPQRKVHHWFSAKRGSYTSTIEVLDALGFLTSEGRAFLGLDPMLRVEGALEAAASASRAGRSRGRS